MAKKEDLVMNGSGVEEIGFPGWPQFAPEVPEKVTEVLNSGKVNYWTPLPVSTSLVSVRVQKTSQTLSHRQKEQHPPHPSQSTQDRSNLSRTTLSASQNSVQAVACVSVSARTPHSPWLSEKTAELSCR